MHEMENQIEEVDGQENNHKNVDKAATIAKKLKDLFDKKNENILNNQY